MYTSRLEVVKTVYAKKRSFDQSLMQKVIKNEVDHHLKQHPDLVFVGIAKPESNEDRSKTYKLVFALGKPSAATRPPVTHNP